MQVGKSFTRYIYASMNRCCFLV